MASEILGTRIDNGRIYLKSIIGTGSFATVFLGVSTKLINKALPPKQYAVKTLFKKYLANAEINAQREEYKIISKVSQHNNIITHEKLIETSKHIHLIMEKCELDLYDAIIALKSPFPSCVAKEIFNQLLDAVMYCHSKGVYHRDIKPENVLIAPDYTITLADFGLSTFDSWSTEFGCGTIRYMAPECFEKNTKNQAAYSSSACDVWALGITLINILTGSNPWAEATSSDHHYRFFLENPDAFLKKYFHFSDKVDHLLKRMFDDVNTRCTLTEVKEILEGIEEFFQKDDNPPLSPISSTPSFTSCSTASGVWGSRSPIVTLDEFGSWDSEPLIKRAISCSLPTKALELSSNV